MKIIIFLNRLVYGNTSLISDEAKDILNDKNKKDKLLKWIENYKKTGFWDFSFWE